MSEWEEIGIVLRVQETTVLVDGREEIIADWFLCEMCGCRTIQEDHKFCPGCGRYIKWVGA